MPKVEIILESNAEVIDLGYRCMSHFDLVVASQYSERELDPRRKVYSTAAPFSVRTDTSDKVRHLL